MLAFFSILSILPAIVRCKEACYDDLELGCFTDSKPFGGTFQRPLPLPLSPAKIETKFTLFNALNTNGATINSSVLNKDFVPCFNTKFIVHGFLHKSTDQWVIDMKNTLLEAERVNVIVVDWEIGSRPPYAQASTNTQVVGREVAKLINSLCEKSSAVAEDFHLIGHSLGAHACGYAGERLKSFYSKELGRITGLDCAGPYFEGTPSEVRLDPSDAMFVDAIHTDGEPSFKLGLGIFEKVGHVDFYPNGGINQPDCPAAGDKFLNNLLGLASLDYDSVEKGVACSHRASFHYFTDSIKNQCKYNAYPCESEKDFNKGSCLRCSDKGCNRMGYWATPGKDNGRLFLNTKSPSGQSYCKPNYKITLFSDKLDGVTQTRGLFKFYLVAKDRQSRTQVLDNSETTFKRDSIVERLVAVDWLNGEEIGTEIESIFISFEKTFNLVSGWMYADKWNFKYVDVFSGDAQVSMRFCPSASVIQSGKTVQFNKCLSEFN